MRTEIRIEDSIIMLNDEFPQMNCLLPQSVGGTSAGIFLYGEDADAVFNKAVSAGAKATMSMMDVFWGDRCGQIEGPFGHYLHNIYVMRHTFHETCSCHLYELCILLHFWYSACTTVAQARA